MATVAIIAGVVSAGAAVAGVVQQRRASRAQRRQAEVANRIQANQRMRSVRRAIAAARVRRAQAEAAGFGLGVAGGTAVGGAVSGIQGDLATSVGASNQQFTGQQAVTAIANRRSELLESANTFAGIGGIAGQFSGPIGAQNLSAIQNLFTG